MKMCDNNNNQNDKSKCANTKCTTLNVYVRVYSVCVSRILPTRATRKKRKKRTTTLVSSNELNTLLLKHAHKNKYENQLVRFKYISSVHGKKPIQITKLLT